jgi:hypothetical protein
MRGRFWIVVRWGAVIVLAVIGLWLLNLAAFHSWASWGPPTPNPGWHRRWSYIFGVGGLASLSGSAIALWRTIRSLRELKASFHLGPSPESVRAGWLTRRLQPTHRQKQRWAAEAGSFARKPATESKYGDNQMPN